MDLFYGDIPLCYTKSLAMALSSYGYNIYPEYLEGIMVMGNGASIVSNDSKHPLVFFDNGLPDVSISNSLRILGFTYKEFFTNSLNNIQVNEIKEKLKYLLTYGSVVAGPIDMGYLTYNPNSINLSGVDHFVSIYDVDEEFVYLHDPAGYPCMKIVFKEFIEAWKANLIDYKRGSFSMWGKFKKVKTPNSEKIFHEVSLIMKKRYQKGENNVMEKFAHAVRDNGLNQEQKQILQFFSFRLASARNLYISKFLKSHDSNKSKIKEQLAELFGQAHLSTLKEDYFNLAHTLEEIAQLDEEFKALCLQIEGED